QVGNPLLVQLLGAENYAIGIYADHFERHKIAATLFHGIAVHDTFVTGSPDQRDADMNRQMESFIADEVRRHQHFFSYEFFKSTHYSYYYPPASARFEPSEKLPVGMAGDRSHLPAYLNDYRNSVHYVDQLMGQVFSELDSLGIADSTIVV